MSKNTYPIARKFSVPLDRAPQQFKLTRAQREELVYQMGEMLRIDEEAEAARRILAAIYVQTLQEIDNTLLLAELIKASRCPARPTDELDEIDQLYRQKYLNAMEEIVDLANDQVLAQLYRSERIP